jgi:hypothetical protein
LFIGETNSAWEDEMEGEKRYRIYRISKDSEWYDWKDKMLGMTGKFVVDRNCNTSQLWKNGEFTPDPGQFIDMTIYMYAVQLQEIRDNE